MISTREFAAIANQARWREAAGQHRFALLDDEGPDYRRAQALELEAAAGPEDWFAWVGETSPRTHRREIDYAGRPRGRLSAEVVAWLDSAG